ncbi:MAG: DUF4870 domain-containing protein [Planctomycetota bacterium]|jgi:uncharacterized Tic20 family protein
MAEMNETPEPAEIPEEQSSAASGGAGEEISKDARMWAMFCHLAGLGGLVVPAIGSVIAPLVIWQIKKDEFEFVDDQGKEAVNFQISILIYALVAGLLCFACIGFFLLPAVYIFDLIFLLIAGIKANNGEHYRYPLTIRFIK